MVVQSNSIEEKVIQNVLQGMYTGQTTTAAVHHNNLGQ